MRLCVILGCAVGLLSGCITATEIENSGVKTTRSYVLFIPVKKTVVQIHPPPEPADLKSRPVAATSPSR